MRTEDARFSYINVDHNIDIAGIRLIDEDTGRITTDLVATMEDFSAAATDPRVNEFEADIQNLKLTTYGPDVTVGGIPSGLVANVEALQQDISELRDTSYAQIETLKLTTYGPEVTVGGTPTGLVANVEALQQDISELRTSVESNYAQIETLNETDQNVQNNAESIGLIESQQIKLQANVDDLYALIASLKARVDQLGNTGVPVEGS